MASDGARKQFWKRSNSKVPGRSSSTCMEPSTRLLIRCYTAPCSNDDELLAMATESLNSEVVMETAHLVTFACESTDDTIPLQRSQSLPHSATVTLSGTSDPHALAGSALTKRETSRLDKVQTASCWSQHRPCLLRGVTEAELVWNPKASSSNDMETSLSGYLPANVDRRPATLQRKQKEYFAFIEHYYNSRNDEVHQDRIASIHIDIPRMSPEALILQPKVTEIFERILFIWAIRHPASGYVQGINDLVTPFFVVFICEYTECDQKAHSPATMSSVLLLVCTRTEPWEAHQEDVDKVDVSSVPAEVLRNIEADTYWCMSKLLDGIQDNYTFAQPGIQMKVKMLEELVSRIDERVHRHLDGHEVRYLQFAFRWMNNLLMRELPLRCTIRLWDTYQSEPEDFQELLLFLQNLPTARWDDQDVSLLLAEAYRLKFAFADAPNHYKK
ncbi:TBC1 domain family member 22A [Apodemus speciosus]|uniref:TBC1 domain family member 22A n=1 Tax=Apodemus speciosus TaxID=105296 RepID=A0ABQ0FKC5_APOSI